MLRQGTTTQNVPGRLGQQQADGVDELGFPLLEQRDLRRGGAQLGGGVRHVEIGGHPARRTLLKVQLDDALQADEMFRVLMGEKVEPRRDFIQKHALEVKEIDYHGA